MKGFTESEDYYNKKISLCPQTEEIHSKSPPGQIDRKMAPRMAIS